MAAPNAYNAHNASNGSGASGIPSDPAPPSSQARVDFWRFRAWRLQVQVNGARALEVYLPGMAVAGFLAGCTMLWCRRYGVELGGGELTIGGGVLASALSILAGHRVKRYWLTEKAALARLDAHLRLHNRLTSASEGVGEWPAPMTDASGGMRWRWERVMAPVLASLLFVIAAYWIPMAPAEGGPRGQVAAPLAWEQLQASLEALKEEALVSPDALAALERKLAELAGQPEEQWYQQSNLEASDALKQEATQGMQQLLQNLEQAARLAEQQREQLAHTALTPSEQAAAWEKMLDPLKKGALPLSPEQLAALQQRAMASSMTQEQMEALSQKLSAQAESVRNAMDALGSLEQALNERMESEALQEGDAGGGPEGGDHQPLGIQKNAQVIPPSGLEALPESSEEARLFGSTIATTESEHEVDPNAPSVRQSGGAAEATGQGGDAVWKDDLLPEEKAFLKRFFK